MLRTEILSSLETTPNSNGMFISCGSFVYFDIRVMNLSRNCQFDAHCDATCYFLQLHIL